MSSAQKCSECVNKNGLNIARCSKCKPHKPSPNISIVEGCPGGACCSCINKHGGEMEKLPCQSQKE